MHLAAQRFAIKFDREQTFLEQRRMESERAVAIDAAGIAVEQQIVLAADQVDVQNRQTCFLCARGQHLIAFGGFVLSKWRGVDVDQQLGAGAPGGGRRIRPPHVLADAQADGNFFQFE